MRGGNIKAVCSWMRNSRAVVLQYYAQTTKADMKEAAKNTVLNEAENHVQNESENYAKERVANQEHSIAETDGNVQKEGFEELNVTSCNCENLPQDSEPCGISRNDNYWAVQDLNL